MNFFTSAFFLNTVWSSEDLTKQLIYNEKGVFVTKIEEPKGVKRAETGIRHLAFDI
jgi:hypothetical protein